MGFIQEEDEDQEERVVNANVPGILSISPHYSAHPDSLQKTRSRIIPSSSEFSLSVGFGLGRGQRAFGLTLANLTALWNDS